MSVSSIHERLIEQKEAIADKEQRIAVLSKENSEIESSLPDLQDLKKEIERQSGREAESLRKLEILRREEDTKRIRIAELKERIRRQREENAALSQETEAVLLKVRNQSMSKAE